MCFYAETWQEWFDEHNKYDEAHEHLSFKPSTSDKLLFGRAIENGKKFGVEELTIKDKK